MLPRVLPAYLDRSKVSGRRHVFPPCLKATAMTLGWEVVLSDFPADLQAGTKVADAF